MTNNQILLVAVALAAGTLITRFLPFLLFPQGKEMPKYVEYLGRTLPYATMGLLVVYCLKGISVSTSPFGIPELLAVLVVIHLHIWKKNSLLSIGAGTVFYMVLVQMVFVP